MVLTVSVQIIFQHWHKTYPVGFFIEIQVIILSTADIFSGYRPSIVI